MPFEIKNWNINPNRDWFVRLAIVSGEISAGLYLTAADAQAQTDRQAHGSAAPGSDVAIVLTADTGATVAVSFFQETEPWHLVVAGTAGDPVRILRVKAFVDLDDITHPAYRNAELVKVRALSEVNAHTHLDLARTLEIAGHLPGLEPGDILALDSARRGIDQNCQVTEHVIRGGPDSLVSTITCSRFVAVAR